MTNILQFPAKPPRDSETENLVRNIHKAVCSHDSDLNYNVVKLNPQSRARKNQTVIRGTYRNADLIEALFAEWLRIDNNQSVYSLEPMDTDLSEFYQSSSYAAYLDIPAILDDEWSDSAHGIDVLEFLFMVLDSLAPNGYYFGAHEGNSSDFGFWEYSDSETHY